MIIAWLGGLAVAPAWGGIHTNSIGMKFKDIPAGSFYMGSCMSIEQTNEFKHADKKQKFLGTIAKSTPCPSGTGIDKDAEENETPQHKVRISKGFQIGVYEVTLGQFKRFIVESGRDDLVTDMFMKLNSHGDDAAVLWVSWADVQDFITWLNGKEKGYHYRLPTEAEWEYAARAGTTSRFYWGDSGKPSLDYAWHDDPDRYDEHVETVGDKKPNPWGLYDMAGNAAEWVQDWYSADFYKNSPEADPTGPPTGDFRANRGCGWGCETKLLRSASRSGQLPSLRTNYIGFRLVRVPLGKKQQAGRKSQKKPGRKKR